MVVLGRVVPRVIQVARLCQKKTRLDPGMHWHAATASSISVSALPCGRDHGRGRGHDRNRSRDNDRDHVQGHPVAFDPILFHALLKDMLTRVEALS